MRRKDKAVASGSGDMEELLSSLFLKHYDYLRDLARYFGCSRDLAEDMVQETFEIVLRQPDKLLNSENKLAWLVGILKNRIGYAKRSTLYAEQLLRRLQQVYVGEYSDELKLTTLYGNGIDPGDLELLIRFYAEGWSHAELAKEKGISPASCRKRIQRTKEKLRELLEENTSQKRNRKK